MPFRPSNAAWRRRLILQTRVSWGKLLSNLKDDREANDYDPVAFVDQDTARRAVTEAEALVAEVAGYLERLGDLRNGPAV